MRLNSSLLSNEMQNNFYQLKNENKFLQFEYIFLPIEMLQEIIFEKKSNNFLDFLY